MQETKQTLYELIAGIVSCFILFLLGNIFVSNRIAYTLGLLTGCLIAGVMSGHIQFSFLKNLFIQDNFIIQYYQSQTKMGKISCLQQKIFPFIFVYFVHCINARHTFRERRFP